MRSSSPDTRRSIVSIRVAISWASGKMSRPARVGVKPSGPRVNSRTARAVSSADKRLPTYSVLDAQIPRGARERTRSRDRQEMPQIVPVDHSGLDLRSSRMFPIVIRPSTAAQVEATAKVTRRDVACKIRWSAWRSPCVKAR